MTENRTDRTTNLGLLALMQSPSGGGPSSGTQGWGWPYWNQLWLDALIAALHEAARTGEALLTAPATGPTVELSSTTGYLPAGLTLEVCQTWVDEYGRETDAGTVSEISTGEAIPDPDTAAALGAPTPAASGFDGGLLEVAYSWIDEAAGETISSPTSQVDIPYRTGGLQSEVVVTLPATPLSVGAAGAFIYARHRSGNWVRAAAISDPAEDEVTLDGTWISCFVALPLANSTGAGKAIDITGIEAPAAAALTRFYVRAAGEAWTSGDRRLCISGADEWDPASITYPLIYTGAASGLAPGYPPPVSQVKAIRQIDLATEVDGVLDESQIDEAIARDSEVSEAVSGVAGDLSDHEGDSLSHFTGTEKATRLLSSVQKTGLTDGGETILHTHPGLGESGVAGGPVAVQLGLQILTIEEWLLLAHRSLVSSQIREVQTMISQIADYPALQPYLEQHRGIVDAFTSAYLSADGVVSGLVGSDGGGTTLDYSAGAALVNGTEYLAIGASSISLTDDATNYVYVGTDGNMANSTTGWPETRHAKVCTAAVASGVIGTINNSVKVVQDAYDGANDRLAGTTVSSLDCSANGYWPSTATDHASSKGDTWKAVKFTGKGLGDYHVSIRMMWSGSTTARVCVYNDSGGHPGSEVAYESLSYPGNTDWAAHTVDFADLDLTNAAQYWVVLKEVGGAAYVRWARLGGSGNLDYDDTSDAGGSWSTQTNNGKLAVAVSKDVPGEATWYSRALVNLGEVTRVVASLRRAVDDDSVWDDDLYFVNLYCRFAAGGDWELLALDDDAVPAAETPDQIELKAVLGGLDAAHYPVVTGLGVVWEV